MELKASALSKWAPGKPARPIIPDNARCVLLFGPDEGGMLEFFRSLSHGGCIHRYDANKLDVAEISARLGARSLFADPVIVVIDGATEKTLKSIEAIATTNFASDAMLVVKAGDINKSSKLRKYFAAANSHVSVPFYLLREREILQCATQVVGQMNLRLARDVESCAGHYLSGDRAQLARDCEVIALHALGRSSACVEISDLRAVLDDIDESGYSAPLDNVLEGDLVNALRLAHLRLASGEGFVPMLRSFSSRLLRLRAMLETGLSPDQAVSKARPPVFWSEQPRVRAMLGKLDLPKIDAILHQVDRCEFHIIEQGARVDGAITHMLCAINQAMKGGK